MNTRLLHLCLASLAAVTTVSCTLYVIAELSGSPSSTSTTLGDCFNLANNQCGQCIATQCEQPNAQPPVSLKQVCTLDQSGEIVFDVGNCANDPRLANSYCTFSYLDAGAYAPSIDTTGPAESNLKKCIFDNCFNSCSECNVPVPSCGSTVTLVEAGTCGTCLDNAMNRPDAACQGSVFQGACYEDPSSPVAACAASSPQCATRDCSGLSAPGSDVDDAGFAFFTCLWTACASSCQ
jgi:hypothetical protein